MPYDAPTMSSTNGTPNNAGYRLNSLPYPDSLSGLEEKGGMLVGVQASEGKDPKRVRVSIGLPRL